MAKNKRKNWQALGFKTYRDFQKAENQRKRKTIFNECLLEAATAEKERLQLKTTRLEQLCQESEDRQQYHELRLKGL